MSTVIGESYPYPLETAHRRRIELEAVVTFGATGAVGTPVVDDPGFVITRTGAGAYSLAFPAGADNGGSLDVTVISPAGTVRGFYCLTFVPNSGAATIQLVNAAGASTEAATADQMRIQLFLNSRRDF